MPSDFRYPISFDHGDRTLLVAGDDRIRQLVELVLLTTPGERVRRPTLGTGLAQLVFEPNGEALASTLEQLAQTSLQQWLGDLIDVESVLATSKDATLTVTVVYSVLRSGERVTHTVERSV